MKLHRAVVTGMGTINPIAHNLDELWPALVSGKSGAAPIQGFDATRLSTKFACQIKEFDFEGALDRRLVQRTARFAQLALISSQMAIKHSGLEISREDPYRCGVELGTGIGGFEMMTGQSHEYLAGGRLHPLFVTMVIPNIAAAQVALAYGLKGQNATVVTACAASTQALGNAYRAIKYGQAEVILAIGTEASLCPVGIEAFNAIKALSTRNDEPARASRPFDRDRDGFVPGEGAGTLVLESW
ncbi:MAG: beta-ketoacyl-[acyl-carrier-protein] synthase family protein, partial [Candidatus Dormibacteraceae bacterium]